MIRSATTVQLLAKSELILLSIIRQWEQEYLRRLAREIGRVTPNGEILFGDGLHPIDANFDFDRYLQGSGFRHDAALYATLAKSCDIMARSPFIFKKTEN